MPDSKTTRNGSRAAQVRDFQSRGRSDSSSDSADRSRSRDIAPSSEVASTEMLGALSESPFSQSTFEYHAALLGDPRMSNSMHTRQRAVLVRQLQRDYGNQYVQRLVRQSMSLERTESNTLQTAQRQEQPVRIDDPDRDKISKSAVRRQHHEGVVTQSEFQLEQQKTQLRNFVNRWHTRYIRNLEENAGNARNANERLIDFEEGAISELRTVGSLAGGVIALFGGPAAVVGLCVTVLTEVAAQNLSGKSEKIAMAVGNLNEKERLAKAEIDGAQSRFLGTIDVITSTDPSEWAPLWNEIANRGVPEVVPENIIYRDLLLAYARGGGYNVSGSQWHVDNGSIFGDAPWYHSWDWGSPGWRNGKDIAAELNALAADPSTRIEVEINPP